MSAGLEEAEGAKGPEGDGAGGEEWPAVVVEPEGAWAGAESWPEVVMQRRKKISRRRVGERSDSIIFS